MRDVEAAARDAWFGVYLSQKRNGSKINTQQIEKMDALLGRDWYVGP